MKFFITTALILLSASAQAERTFEEKKFILQSTTVVSTLIHSGRVIAEATLANDLKCKENRPSDGAIIEIGGEGCSIYFYERLVLKNEADGSELTSAKIRLTTKFGSAEVNGEYHFEDDKTVKFKGTGMYTDYNRVVNIETVSEFIFFNSDRKNIRDLQYSSKLTSENDQANVNLASHKDDNGKVSTQAEIDGVTVPQSDLEIMFPNIYKQKH